MKQLSYGRAIIFAKPKYQDMWKASGAFRLPQYVHMKKKRKRPPLFMLKTMRKYKNKASCPSIMVLKLQSVMNTK
jgi:hypothetical protein